MKAMKAKKLRMLGKVELYPDAAKVAKQFQHADKRGIPFAIVVGEKEIAGNTFSLKNLESGEQVSVDFEGLKKRCYNSFKTKKSFVY
jgi:histidyl-tRNA synthetase